MRKKGSVFELKAERDLAIMRAYRAVVSEADSIYIPDIINKVVQQPCARFFVSEERATVVMSMMIRDPDYIKCMRGERQRMFAEIYRRVMNLRRQRPRRPLAPLVREVVNSPAPEFYIAPRSAHNLILKNRQKL